MITLHLIEKAGLLAVLLSVTLVQQFHWIQEVFIEGVEFPSHL